MTISLFSQLISEAKSDLGPSGLQREVLEKPVFELSIAQNAGLTLFWNRIAAESVASGANKINPSSVLAVMASLPEAQVETDDFVFI